MAELSFGVDEFQFTLFSVTVDNNIENDTEFELDSSSWVDLVREMLSEFRRLSQIEEVFGTRLRTLVYGKTRGYDDGLTFPDEPYFFSICWSSRAKNWNMGVSIRFSAHAWAVYQRNYLEKSGKSINIAEFWQMIQSPEIYKTRMSRIDFDADVIEFDNASPDYIARHKIRVEKADGRKSNRNTRKIEKNGIVQTIYYGNSGNSPCSCTVYDKKAEAIEKNNFRRHEAEKVESWTRIEVRFRDTYAWQISDDFLLNPPQTDEDMKRYIAHRIAERYRFIDSKTDKPLEFSQKIIEAGEGAGYGDLIKPSPRDNDLYKSLMYQANPMSGLFSLLFKMRCVYKDTPDADRKTLDFLYSVYESHYLTTAYDNLELLRWRRIHEKESRRISIEDMLSIGEE